MVGVHQCVCSYHKFEIMYFMAQFSMILSIGNISFPEMTENMEPCIVTLLSYKSQFGSNLAVINNDLVTNGLIRKIHDSNNVRLNVNTHTLHLRNNISQKVIIIHCLWFIFVLNCFYQTRPVFRHIDHTNHNLTRLCLCTVRI